MTAQRPDASKQLCWVEIHILGGVSGVHIVREVNEGGGVGIDSTF